MTESSPATVSVSVDQLGVLMARLEVLENAKHEAEEEAARVAWNAAHEGLSLSFCDLAEHVKARAAQHPEHAAVFAEASKVSAALAARLEPDEGGVVRPPTEEEARLVHTLVHGLARGRDHMELGYLRELADNALTASLRVPAAV